MREILFKGRRTDNGEWVYGYLLKRPSAVCIGEHNPWAINVPPVDPDDSGAEYMVDPETVCQFTGFVDKNAQKLFEGDICDMQIFSEPPQLMIISIYHGCAGYEPMFPEREHPDDRKWLPFWDDEDQEEWYAEYFELIGNIHDEREEPMRHGRWEHDHWDSEFEVLRCSNCKEKAYKKEYHIENGKYCPYCGAKMDIPPK